MTLPSTPRGGKPERTSCEYIQTLFMIPVLLLLFFSSAIGVCTFKQWCLRNGVDISIAFDLLEIDDTLLDERSVRHSP